MEMTGKLAALGDLPAEEGFGAVLVAAANGLLALALIAGVLFLMNRLQEKKNHSSSSDFESMENIEKLENTENTENIGNPESEKGEPQK